MATRKAPTLDGIALNFFNEILVYYSAIILQSGV
jgi:hypothetical protein